MKKVLIEQNEIIQERDGPNDQLLKYARDVSRLYRIELEQREALETANRELQGEILERTRLQAEIARSERKYRSLFEDSFDPIFITAADGILVDANGAYFELFGYEREELLAKTVLLTYADSSRRAVFQKKIEKTGAIRHFPLKARKKDGTVLDCLISATVRTSTEGNLLGYQGIIRDVTELKRSRQVVELAKRMEALAHMAGGIAHEIRNPLAISSSATQLLVNDKIGSDLRNECAEKAISGINRASHIVENLLIFAQPFNDQAITDVNLVAVMLETLKEVSSLAKSQNVDLKTNVNQDSLFCRGNAALLHRAFLNLLLNGLGAMPDGGILLVTVEDKGPDAIIVVKDSGHGIPQELIQRIFDPFFPGSATSKGAGLGLSVTHSILTHHGGSMWVESILGKGATFTVSLPLSSLSA